VTQILNFGAPAPIDVVVTGNDLAANEAYANKVAAGMAKIAGIADVRLQQPSNYPELQVNVDRARADRIGITENDVTKSLSVNLAGSSQVSPTFWLNPKTGVSYPIVVQAPTYNADSVSDLNNVSITGTGGYQTLNQVASCRVAPLPSSPTIRSSLPLTSMPPRRVDLARWQPTSTRCWRPRTMTCPRARP
jgi:multidrug efflux pump subunit AcrB